MRKIPRLTISNILITVFVYLIVSDGFKALLHKDSDETFSSSSSTIVLDECKNVVQNGNFEYGTDQWKAIGPETGLYLLSIDSNVVSVTSDEPKSSLTKSVNALATSSRSEHYYGMAQDLNLDCLKVYEYYEVSLDVMIHDESSNPVTCEPFRYYFDAEVACPTLAIKIQTSNNEIISRPIAKTIGPWNENEWNKAYGVFQVTPDLFHQSKVEIYASGVRAGYNEVISNVVIKPVSTSTLGLRTCSKNLIVNGDAEIGDARFWYLKGGGEAGSFGSLEVVSPGTSMNPNLRSRYAFHHYGSRTHRWNGLWQQLDQNCMSINSIWKVSYQIKVFDPDGNEIFFSRLKEERRPGVAIELITYGEDKEITNQDNAILDTWKIGDEGRNLFEQEFTMRSEHEDKDETWFHLTEIALYHGYLIDNICMTKISC